MKRKAKACGDSVSSAARPQRTCARLCHQAGGELEQIQFLLGHVSVQTTERYLGCKQRFRNAVMIGLAWNQIPWNPSQTLVLAVPRESIRGWHCRLILNESTKGSEHEALESSLRAALENERRWMEVCPSSVLIANSWSSRPVRLNFCGGSTETAEATILLGEIDSSESERRRSWNDCELRMRSSRARALAG